MKASRQPATPRKPRRKRGRVKWTLERLERFVETRDWWPTAPELSAFLRRGSRWTCWRDLSALARAGMVRCDRRVWVITHDGWRYLRLPPRTPQHPRKPKPKSRRKRIAEARARRMRIRLDVFDLLERSEPTEMPSWLPSKLQWEHALPVVD